MNELKSFNSERIYWAVEQVERTAGDIDTLHLDDNQFYLKSETDKVIADLKDKCRMHGFFWDGCGFAKRGFKNTIAVSEAFDRLETENRRLKRALWHSRADRAIMTLDYFTLKCRWFKDYMKVEPPKCDVNMVHKWANIERKCRAKMEEYK